MITIFDNGFKFQGHENNSTSVKGGNTILLDENGSKPLIVGANFVEESKDKILVYNEKKWCRKGGRLVR